MLVFVCKTIIHAVQGLVQGGLTYCCASVYSFVYVKQINVYKL